jgi:hypothetical protein
VAPLPDGELPVPHEKLAPKNTFCGDAMKTTLIAALELVGAIIVLGGFVYAIVMR